MDFYEVLKVSSSATEEEIKASYRSLVLLLHPDKNPGRDTTKEFQILMEAYAILKDPIKKREYDAQRLRTSSNSIPIHTSSRASVDPSLFNSLFEDPFFREHENFFRSFFNHTSTFAPPQSNFIPPPQQQQQQHHYHAHPPPYPHASPFPPPYNPRHSPHVPATNPFAPQGMPGMQPPGHPFAFHMEAMRRHEQMMQQFMGMSGFNPFGVYAAPEEQHSVGLRRTRTQEEMGMGMGSAPKRASTGYTSVQVDLAK